MSTRRELTTAQNQEFAELRLIARLHAEAWKKHATFSRSGASSSATKEQQEKIRAEVGCEFTNEMRSRLEVLEFVANPPDKYFAYIKSEPIHVSARPMGERLLSVTTFTGDELGDIIWQGESFRDSFGGKRLPFRMRGINGLLYAGIYYHGNGTYCRLRRLNERQTKKFQTAERRLRSCLFRPYRKGLPSFALTLWDTYQRDHLGKNVLAYRLTQCEPGKRSRVLFEGYDYSCAPGYAIDSDGCVEGIMGFLCLRPGDTDEDYFKDYTPEQKEFCEQHAEALGCEVQNRFCDEEGRVIAQ